MSGFALSVSVVVPTYRRPGPLNRCLLGLEAQSCPPLEVIVVSRSGDTRTERVLASHPGLRRVSVARPGMLAALAAGARAARGDVIAFTDDDAVPRPDWLERLVEHFADPRVGGVGGRDVVEESQGRRLEEDVGRISPWGKLIGNHHRGTGGPRCVAVLKGCNMAFRREALALPRALRGTGAQVHNEVAISSWARARGWQLVYDPAVLVDHVPAPRFDADRRARPSCSAMRDSAHNLVLCVVTAAPHIFWRRTLYGILLGDAGAPGLARGAVGLAHRETDVVRRLVPSLAGQAQALIAVCRGGRVEMDPIL